MKRALLIAGGTIGGLGAVLAITPPQLGATSMMDLGGASAVAGSSAVGAGSSSTPVAAAAASQSATAIASELPLPKKRDDDDEYEDDDYENAAQATPVATKSATPVATKTATPVATKTATPTATATKATAAPVAKGVNGSFTGPSVFVNYGNVQVKITVVNGKITDAVAVKAPSGRNDRWTNMAVPILKQQTLAAQSAIINGASGASYTSYGWQKSLQGALADAGL